jgi:hypothetical protein
LTLGLDPAGVRALRVPPRLWWRVYPEPYGALGYNKTSKGNARFSPITDAKGKVIPTLYAATTPAVALMETVLRDAPWPSDGYILSMPPTGQETRRMACLVNALPLQLADFTALGLRKLGLKKPGIVETDKTGYPYSRSVAQWLYAVRPDLQGILWSSRQDDRGQAVVLFAPRLKVTPLHVWHQGESIAQSPALDELVDLLDALGAGVIFE